LATLPHCTFPPSCKPDPSGTTTPSAQDVFGYDGFDGL
jgi:hypothetical protein